VADRARHSAACNPVILAPWQPDVEASAVKFERIITDAPCRDRRAWSAIRVPTLVLANRRDPIHPYARAGRPEPQAGCVAPVQNSIAVSWCDALT